MSNAAESTWSRVAVIRTVLVIAAVLVVIAATALPGFSQSRPHLQSFFEQNIGLSQDQIAAIRNGQPVAKTLPSRTPAEVFLSAPFYILPSPGSYARFAHDFKRLRK